MSVTATIQGTPRPMPRPRFMNGKAFTPRGAKRTQRMIAEQVMVAMREDGRTEPLEGPVQMAVTFYFQRAARERKGEPDAWRTKTPDSDNLYKLVLDSLNGVAYVDDRQVVSGGFRKFDTDEPSHMIIEIEQLDV